MVDFLADLEMDFLEDIVAGSSAADYLAAFSAGSSTDLSTDDVWKRQRATLEEIHQAMEKKGPLSSNIL